MNKAPSPRFYDLVVGVLGFLSRRMARIEVEGLDRIPAQGGVILTPNHVSHVDPVILGTTLRRSGRRTRALAKASLFSAPGVGLVLTKMGHIPVYRDSAQATEALRSAIEQVRLGEVLAVYPEGTVPKDGARLGPFKTGAARLALATGAPVVPIAQVGSDAVLPAVKTRGTLRPLLTSFLRRRSVRIIVGEPLVLAELFPTPDPEDRSQVAQAAAVLEARISTLLANLESPAGVAA